MDLNNAVYRIAVFNGDRLIYENPYSFPSLIDVDKFCTGFANKQKLIETLQESCEKRLDGRNMEVKILRYVESKRRAEITPVLYEYDKAVFNEEDVNDEFIKNIKSPSFIYVFLQEAIQNYNGTELESIVFYIKSIKKILISETSFEDLYNSYSPFLELLLGKLSGHELCRVKYLSLKKDMYGDDDYDFVEQEIDPKLREAINASYQSLMDYMESREYMRNVLKVNTEYLSAACK